MKILAIIPAYNEAKGIAVLVRDVRAFGLDTLVIDDGSGDATAEIAKEHGAIILKHECNKGKGMTLREGFRYALVNGYEAVITMDGDGQHHPADLPKFLEGFKNPENAIVIGNRMQRVKGMPLTRFLTNKFMSYVLSKVCRQGILDSQCGYRLIRRQILERAGLSTNRYEIESELLIRASRLGYRILSVPIETIYSGSKSQINPFIDTLRFFRFIFKELWTSRT